VRLEIHKTLVQAVVVERDDQGRAVGERVAEPVPIYTLDQYAEYLAALAAELEAATNGASAPTMTERSATMSETTETPAETPAEPETDEPETDDGDEGENGDAGDAEE
jgi:hypothetical protein